MRACQLGAGGLDAFLAALGKNTCLTSWNLLGTSLGPGGAAKLVAALETQHTLTSLLFS